VNFIRYIILLSIALTAVIADAQTPPAPSAPPGQSPAGSVADLKEIAIDLIVNYGFGYRARTWVTVDAFVRNPVRDVKGWLEIRVYQGDVLESPIYRVPAESPKSSMKRFSVCCYLTGINRIEARLYDGGDADGGGRQVTEFPSYVDAQPINSDDLLTLVLDTDGIGFGFLNEVITLDGNPNDERRFYRELIREDSLAFMPRYPQCYAPFNAVIFGETEPAKIPPRQQELLREYVRQGGTLVVCTGEHAPKYRGTWIEDLLGVTIGPDKIVNELALATDVFPPDQQNGAKDFRNCVVATLTPAANDVKRLAGNEHVLATRRTIGSGAVYTFAVDAESQALQACTGFLRIWKEAVAGTTASSKIDMNQALSYVSSSLPWASGIVIHSRASVLAYLALYFLVGIVLNWIFFSWIKRREWAWAALVLFSIAFTAYAVVYGTAGRARSSEISQIEVLTIPKGDITQQADPSASGARIASLTAITGLLTAGTTTCSVDLGREYALAQDVGQSMNQPQMYGGPSVVGRAERAFYLIQGEESGKPRVAGFRLGASSMRLLQVLADVTVPGGVDGTITLKEGNALDVDLINNTGFTLSNPFLYFEGASYPLSAQGKNFKTTIEGMIEPNMVMNQGFGGFGMRRPSRFGNDFSASSNIESFRAKAANSIRQGFPSELFTVNMGYYGQQYGRQTIDDPSQYRPNVDLGPFLCGWVVKDTPVAPITPDTDAKRTITETFVVADVNVTRGNVVRLEKRSLDVMPALSNTSDSSGSRNFAPGPLGPAATRLACDDTFRGFIVLPADILETDAGDLTITLTFSSIHEHELELLPEGAPDTWPAEHRLPVAPQTAPRGRGMETVTYRLPANDENGQPGWRSLLKNAIGQELEIALQRYRQQQLAMRAIPSGMQRGGAPGIPAAPPRAASAVTPTQPEEDRPAKFLTGIVRVVKTDKKCEPTMANDISVTASIMVPRKDKWEMTRGESGLWR